MASQLSVSRKGGVRLSTERIDFELGRRAVTQRTVAAVAGIPALTMSRARRGQPVSERTVRRISEALVKIPLAVGADALLAEPGKRTTEASEPASVEQETSRDRGRPS
jgi:hypothetical protein